MGCVSSRRTVDVKEEGKMPALANPQTVEELIDLAEDGFCNLSNSGGDDDNPQGLIHKFEMIEISSFKDSWVPRMKAKGVTNLSLKANEIQSLPSALVSLKSLVSMNLSENHLQELPSDLGTLSALQTLDISENEISALPKSIGDLSELRTLIAFKNLLTKLPDEIGQCSKLEEVNFFNNKMIRLPASFSNIPRLQDLNLGGNKLKTLPKTDKWTSMKALKCHQNGLIMLPSFETMTRITMIKMDMNRALREMPEFGLGMSAVEHLELHHCDFSVIPDSINTMSALHTLNVQNNAIVKVPVLKLPCLDIFNIGNNKVDELPQDLGANCPKLRVFFCQNNQIAVLPDSMQTLSKLERVMCGGNKLDINTPAVQKMKTRCEENRGWLRFN